VNVIEYKKEENWEKKTG